MPLPEGRVMHKENRIEIAMDDYAMAAAGGDATASTIVRLEDFQYIRTQRKGRDLRRTALYEALNTVETLPKIRAMRRSRQRHDSARPETRGVFGRLWSWVRGRK